jgi:hypothetical protein
MHRRSLVLIAILVVALLAGAGGVYAYDAGKEGQIAEGIKVNGVDVGGMSSSQARRTLRAALLDPLNRPVTARFEGKRYRLTPEQAQIGVDIDGSVQRALTRSREATSSAAPGGSCAASRSSPTSTPRSPTPSPRSAGLWRACSAT